MIDIHSHIIFGVDDGPCTIEKSISMIYNAEKAGIKTIVATPHSHETFFETERLYENYQELLYRIHEYDIILKLGYEVFMNPFLPAVDKKNIGLTLDNTRYLLFELPFNTSPKSGFEVLYSIRLKDYIPILAHPERNRRFLKNFNELSGYINAGCMIQIDAGSIIGVYGRDIKEFVKKLVKQNRVDFVASNAHCAEDYTNWYLKAYSQVSKWSGEDNANRLFESNAESILNREEKMHAVL
jgi:protein-tyrosine phosphatase